MRTCTEPSWSTPERQGFAALMELYEQNYILLRRLCPELREMGGSDVSRSAGIPALHLRVLESGPYATTFHMTGIFEGVPDERLPDLRLRIYHDARVAEVCPEPDLTPESIHSLLHHRLRGNRFLNRWLTYCLSRGYSFINSTEAV